MKSIKYNDFVNYEWDITLIQKNDKYIIGKGEANRQLIHHGKGKVFSFENPSIEFYPLHEWFTVSIEKCPNNGFKYYCNICMPSQISNDVVSFLDLDLDLIKIPGEDWIVVDEDEFLVNSKKYNYPEWLINRTVVEKDKLLERIANNIFPFDGTMLSVGEL
jgi:Uncharacterized domain/protein associated with RNAses G and E